MTQHLVRWHNEHADDGLVIISVVNGAIDSLNDVKSHVLLDGIPFVTVHDARGEICRAYGVRVYPTACLIGRDGAVRWIGHPTSSPNTALAYIRTALE